MLTSRGRTRPVSGSGDPAACVRVLGSGWGEMAALTAFAVVVLAAPAGVSARYLWAGLG